MRSFTYTIREAVGIHARPASLLTKEAKTYRSTITITRGNQSVNAIKLVALMCMGVKCGETVTVQVEGPDEDIAGPAMERFFQQNL